MKIGDRKDLVSPRVAEVGAVRRGVTGPLTAAAVADDVVSVSDAARELAVLRIGVGDPMRVRTEKVSELRAAMARGEYRVDTEHVARDLLRDVLGQLLS